MPLSVEAEEIWVPSLSLLAEIWSSRAANCAAESCSARPVKSMPLPPPSEEIRLAVAEPDEVAEVAELVGMLSRTVDLRWA
ncbi:hypothetical protein NSE01_35790 [Novosphingobium sediminis]|uniref:Uncharacterized protein n=1 Tax=Novosphingobium sediminis TaxID=707214 RepID=A0A512AQ73_9SPHN|nr:hypothetical protein NSE01_35790 [Novosphingobium sediminis]